MSKLKSKENTSESILTYVNKTKKRKASASPEKQLKKTTTTVDETSKQQKANLKIVSWNVNGIRAWLTNGGLKYLESEQADIICFQELKCDKQKIPVEATPNGYKSYWLSGDQGRLIDGSITRRETKLNENFFSWIFGCWSIDKNRAD